MTRKLLEWLPAVLWMAGIFILSAQPQLPGPDDHTSDFILKKSAHAVVYGVLALLLLFANRRNARPFTIAFAIATLYAVFDEYHQSLVPLREATLRDIIIDSAAAGTALVLLRWCLPRLKVPLPSFPCWPH